MYIVFLRSAIGAGSVVKLLHACYNVAMKKTRALGERIRLTVAVVTIAVFLATALGALYYRFKNGRSVYYDLKVAEFEKMNADEEKNGIVFLGDSITDFCDTDTYYPGYDAINRGIAGDLTIGVLRRMEESVFALEPRLVVLLIGINDLSRGYTTDSVTENILKITDEIKARLPDTIVIVQSIYPVNSVHGKAYALRLNPLIPVVNAALEACAEEHGYVFVNVYPSLDDGTGSLVRGYSDDGLHPNAEGYAVVSSVLTPYLEKYAPQ